MNHPRRPSFIWSFPVALAAGAGIGFYMLGPVLGGGDSVSAGSILLMLSSALAVPSGLGLTFLHLYASRGNRFAVFCIGFSAGMLLFSLHSMDWNFRGYSASFGLRDDTLSLTGVCTEDPRTIGDGRTLISVQLRYGENREGVAAQMSGTVVVLTPDSRTDEISWGSVIELPSVSLPERGSRKELSIYSRTIRMRGWSSPVFAFRHRIRALLLRSSAGWKGGELYAALSLGYRDALSPHMADTFRKAGVAHILALSGMHLGIIAAAVYLLLIPLCGKSRAFWISAVFVGLYIFLTGPRPSLLRAGLMYFLVGCMGSRGRRAGLSSVLAWTFVLHLLCLPGDGGDVSFLLSYTAVAGIVILGPVFARWGMGILPSFLNAPLAVAVAAQAVSLPLSAAFFGMVYPVGILMGLILGPLVTLFLYAGTAATFFQIGPFHAAGIWNTSTEFLYTSIVVIAEGASRIPGISFRNWVHALLSGLAVTCCLWSVGYMIRWRRCRKYHTVGIRIPQERNTSCDSEL